MAKQRTFVILVFCATTVFGCATYKPPAQGSVASVDFEFIGSKGYVYIGKGPECDQQDLTFDRANVPVSADGELWIQQGINTSGLPVSMACEFRYSFSPKANAKYVSQYSLSGGRCTIQLFEIVPSGERVPVRDIVRRGLRRACFF